MHKQFGVTSKTKKHFGGVVETGMQQGFEEKHAPLMLENCFLQAGDESQSFTPVFHYAR